MHGIIVRRQPTRRELIEWHASDPVRIVESAAGRDYDDWQYHLRHNHWPFIGGHKGRQAGFTWVACDQLFDNGVVRLPEGHQGTVISISQRDAEDAVQYVRELHDALPPRFRYPLDGDSRTELVMRHPNGKRWHLLAFPNRPPRGRHGDVFWDEAAHGRGDAEVFKGLLPCLSTDSRNQVIVASTGWAKRGVFYNLVQRADGKYRQWDWYLVPWWLCPRLCVDVVRAEIEAPLLSTRERVERFGTQTLQAIYDSYPDEESFRVEFELDWLEAADSLFDPEMLEAITEPDWGPRGEYPCLVVEGVPSLLDWKWLRENVHGVLFSGYDVGRRRNESVLAIWDMTRERLEVRMLIRLQRVDFDGQEEALLGAVDHGNVLRGLIDSTGIGTQLAERMAKARPGRYAGVDFSQPLKDMLATKTYIQCTARERRVWMPRYRPLIAHFLSIKKEVSKSGKIIYSVAANEQAEGQGHHADIFWALALGLEAGQVGSWSVSDVQAGGAPSGDENHRRIFGG